MATHSGILAWEIPWTEEPDGPQSMGSHRQRSLAGYFVSHTHTHTHTLSLPVSVSLSFCVSLTVSLCLSVSDSLSLSPCLSLPLSFSSDLRRRRTVPRQTFESHWRRSGCSMQTLLLSLICSCCGDGISVGREGLRTQSLLLQTQEPLVHPE